MREYIALLRSVNVGGNNKLSMSILKEAMENQGFKNVKTYINSGNIIFDSSMNMVLNHKILQSLIQKVFSLTIDIVIITSQDLKDAYQSSPEWWGTNNPELIHYAVFIIDGFRQDVISYTEDADESLESIAIFKTIIFWTANKSTYKTSKLGMLPGKELYRKVTIRNLNTVKKLLELA